MTSATASTAPTAATASLDQGTWTCPFCALLCDRFAIRASVDGDQLALAGGDCPRAAQALASFAAEAKVVVAHEAIATATLDAAAAMLRGARQPLFAGMGTDIDGTRALYRLGARTRAIFDHAGFAALQPGLRTLQDRGLFQTTLAEVRTRADLIVVFGSQPSLRYPEIYRRLDIGTGTGTGTGIHREIVFVGVDVDPALADADSALRREAIAFDGDACRTVAQLAAACNGRSITDPALAELARRMLAAHYVVVIWEPGRLPGSQADLLVETLDRTIKTLNRTTRAGGLALAGDDGALTVNQTLAWLTGWPLRTAVTARGLEHEPQLYDTGRLLADGAVDLLLWVDAFSLRSPPPNDVPMIVLGRPPMDATSIIGARTAPTFFFSVATPGIGAPGHLFRVDGTVVIPLSAARPDGLPTVAAVAAALDARLAGAGP